ncbi:MAG: hypothetical protein HS108_10260 [Planctomycetes bacterium]|jgi:hypothetical protein|nr:hypothetical protein [Planctomycetota bacterium]
MVRHLIGAFAVVLAALWALPLAAEEQNYWPRMRQTQDLVRQASDTRYRDPQGLLGQGAFSAGFRAGYISDYYWRGFRLFNEDLLFHGDAYVNVYGFEASAWGIWDVGREQTRPLEVDYRFGYNFEIEGALFRIGYTYFDFSGSDGDIGRKDQGFGRRPLEHFPDNKFNPSVHEVHLMLSYFTSLVQDSGANMRYTLNLFQRVVDEGTRIDSTITVFVDSPGFTIFGDYFEIGTTTTYQHRYLTNRSGFQGQTVNGRMVYNLHKYRMFPMFIQIDGWYYVAFDDDFVDGFYFGASLNFRF